MVVLYNSKKNKQSHIFNTCKKTITTVAFSRDGKYLATGEVRFCICSLKLYTEKRRKFFMSADLTLWHHSTASVSAYMNNLFYKNTRPRDMLILLKDTLSNEDEKLFKTSRSVCSSCPQNHYKWCTPQSLKISTLNHNFSLTIAGICLLSSLYTYSSFIIDGILLY